jgi:dienelactone hydrolase
LLANFSWFRCICLNNSTLPETQTMSHSATSVDYTIDGNPYEGYFAMPGGGEDLPLIVIAHAWGGLGDNEKQKARKIADQLNCAAFAMDVYGKGKRGADATENEALMMPLVQNRAELQNRLAAGLAFAKTQDGVNASKVAAIGYCFGGLSVLDMARANMDVLGVASFHGLLGAADNLSPSQIKPKVLIEHGWQDPMAKPEDVVAIGAEMVAAGADWQLHAHGKAVHSFTTEGADNRAGGTEYDADADRRSFQSLGAFVSELFA